MLGLFKEDLDENRKDFPGAVQLFAFKRQLARYIRNTRLQSPALLLGRLGYLCFLVI
jgi:hypothetical protein